MSIKDRDYYWEKYDQLNRSRWRYVRDVALAKIARFFRRFGL